MDRHPSPTTSSILSVTSSRDLEGHAEITLRVADKDIAFQVCVTSVLR